METRVKEHFALARNGHPELSAVAEHYLEGHEVERKATIVEVADMTRVRRIKEAFVIQRMDKNGKVTLDRDKSVELSNMWLDLVKQFCPYVKVRVQVICYIRRGFLSLFYITVVFRCIMQVFFMCVG